MKIIFFGTPDIAIPSFKLLLKEHEVLALVSQPSKVHTRGNKITDCNLVKLAKENNILVLQPERISKDRNVIEKLKELNPDFFITFAFGQLLSQEILDICPTINLHASLLPKYRGACPICQCIINGDEITGITTMLTELKMDAGNILLQEEINIKDLDAVELTNIIADKAPKLLDKTIKEFNTIVPRKQDESLVSIAPKLSKEDRLIDWNKPVKQIINKIRGNVGYNTCYCYLHNTRIQVLKVKESTSGIKCLDGYIELIKIKPENKKEMFYKDWLNGLRNS